MEEAPSSTTRQERILSFEEIQKQEIEKKIKRPTAKQGGKKVPLKIVKEEDTKNDWGMIDDKDEIDFDRVIKEEK